jgi:hypothetical protein
MRAAALPASTGQRGRDRVDEAGMRVRADQPHAGEAARDQTADERQPGGAVLGGDDVEAERFAEAVPVDADRVHDADVDRPPTLPALDHQRIKRHVRVGRTVERSAPEVLDDRIEALRQPRDLALRHPLDAQLLHQLLHPPRRDAGQVRVGDHRHERLLSPAARLQQPVREVRALAQPRHRELDRADPRVPVALPVAVAAVDPLRRALTVTSAAHGLRVGAHQSFRELLDHRPQQIRARLLKLLAQPARDVHRVLDHRPPPRACL